MGNDHDTTLCDFAQHAAQEGTNFANSTQKTNGLQVLYSVWTSHVRALLCEHYCVNTLVVDKDNLINYQLVISYRLLIRILTNQPTVDKTIALSTNC